MFLTCPQTNSTRLGQADECYVESWKGRKNEKFRQQEGLFLIIYLKLRHVIRQRKRQQHLKKSIHTERRESEFQIALERYEYFAKNYSDQLHSKIDLYKSHSATSEVAFAFTFMLTFAFFLL